MSASWEPRRWHSHGCANRHRGTVQVRTPHGSRGPGSYCLSSTRGRGGRSRGIFTSKRWLSRSLRCWRGISRTAGGGHGFGWRPCSPAATWPLPILPGSGSGPCSPAGEHGGKGPSWCVSAWAPTCSSPSCLAAPAPDAPLGLSGLAKGIVSHPQLMVQALWSKRVGIWANLAPTGLLGIGFVWLLPVAAIVVLANTLFDGQLF